MPDDHTSTLLAAYRDELSAGHAAMKSRDFAEAFRRYERSHILGQRRTGLHVRAHVAMLRVAWKKGDMKELMGQVTRIAAAALFSRIWVPEGNTGGANVSALKPMPIPDDLRRFLGAREE
jgi:hypothetical protein